MIDIDIVTPTNSSSPAIASLPTVNEIIDKPIDSKKLKEGDVFYGCITTRIGGKRINKQAAFVVTKKEGTKLEVKKLGTNEAYKTSTGGTRVRSLSSLSDIIQKLLNTIREQLQNEQNDNNSSDSSNTDDETNSDENKDSNSDDSKSENTSENESDNEDNKDKKEKEEDKKEGKDSKPSPSDIFNEDRKEKKKVMPFEFENLSPEQKLHTTIKAGINNIWMVGPAGCGKSTMARNVANSLNIPYLCISCGIGTSATEFVGYKYPTRESTKFAEYYSKPSIILLDEFTALDPAVAQVCNAALANDEIETTTGLIKRHPNCVIIATSNTFGNGSDRQYVANNQLDSSTIDRFIGGIIEVDYSKEYEAQYDTTVVFYVNYLRSIIKNNDLRRIASTRMIQAGHKLKLCGFKDWRERLIVNWTKSEKEIVQEAIRQERLTTRNLLAVLYGRRKIF